MDASFNARVIGYSTFPINKGTLAERLMDYRNPDAVAEQKKLKFSELDTLLTFQVLNSLHLLCAAR